MTTSNPTIKNPTQPKTSPSTTILYSYHWELPTNPCTSLLNHSLASCVCEPLLVTPPNSLIIGTASGYFPTISSVILSISADTQQSPKSGLAICWIPIKSHKPTDEIITISSTDNSIADRRDGKNERSQHKQ
ncbi:hypothetical protein [Burkholderia stabilis]|uniref:hypothetical protein n=1 Tax=Burkholderia stabilis TaxID=95485 RepID=UPI0012EACC1F|nr:hypothetical protein [Burkholderia stabilis]HDR9489739.1 hypothetical protein [Burkholderia stabilis]HDR9520833.1 hypothetical protein [Burkholderia stabilis]HDR9528584.1 hypothetical protein [Burkholderia stabilis]HDR9536581.1 hypothetical protein [Burkholderia stabilis]HDR9545848.1 hypothetical protein [Burkholderia stabilis]